MKGPQNIPKMVSFILKFIIIQALNLVHTYPGYS